MQEPDDAEATARAAKLRATDMDAEAKARALRQISREYQRLCAKVDRMSKQLGKAEQDRKACARRMDQIVRDIAGSRLDQGELP